MQRPRYRLSLLLLMFMQVSAAHAQMEFERPPIDYHNGPLSDPAARLACELDAGRVALEYEEPQGFLRSVLRAFDIPESSQVLVFSKTSLQLRRISPRRPRAIYFNDETYIGWVQGGDVLEVSTVDPRQGAIFYTLAQDPDVAPRFLRDRGQCLTCHASSRTQGVPGHLVRSVFTDASGQPHFGSGTFTTDDSSPFHERWGGWYVTGTHGSMRHMGNIVSEIRDRPEDIDRERGANVTDLSPLLDLEPYLQTTSDIVALMVLEHQARLHNLLTLASFEARSALHYNGIMNAALDRPEDHLSESTERRIAAVSEKLLRGLLFADEFRLTSAVEGTSAFAEEFMSRGPRDSRGRSLRDLDLRTRLFKYPCSYLILSPSFSALPGEVRDHVTRRLRSILDGTDEASFPHLTAADRRNIRDILDDLRPELLAGSQ